MPQLKKYRRGGKAFPDLTGDGKVTKADILKGRGVFRRKKKKKEFIPGGVVASALGQLAQRSNNPFIQKAGQLATTIGGMTPGGKMVNTAANVLGGGGGGGMGALNILPQLFSGEQGMKVKMKYANEGRMINGDGGDQGSIRGASIADRSPGQRLGDGPFSQAVSYLDNLASDAMEAFGNNIIGATQSKSSAERRWATNLTDNLSRLGYDSDDLINGRIPAHTLAGLGGGRGRELMVYSLQNQAGMDPKEANFLYSNLRNYGRSIEGQKVNVAELDKMMSERGYTSEHAAQLGSAMAGGALRAEKFQQPKIRDMAAGTGGEPGVRDGSGSSVQVFPSPQRFFNELNKGAFRKKDGTYKKGDLTFGFDTFRDFGTSDRPEYEFDAEDQITPTEDPMDPMGDITRKDPDPFPTPDPEILPSKPTEFPTEERETVEFEEEDEITGRFNDDDDDDEGGEDDVVTPLFGDLPPLDLRGEVTAVKSDYFPGRPGPDFAGGTGFTSTLNLPESETELFKMLQQSEDERELRRGGRIKRHRLLKRKRRRYGR